VTVTIPPINCKEMLWYPLDPTYKTIEMQPGSSKSLKLTGTYLKNSKKIYDMDHLKKNNLCEVKVFPFVMQRNAGVTMKSISWSYLNLNVASTTKPGKYTLVINRSTSGNSDTQTLTLIVKKSKEQQLAEDFAKNNQAEYVVTKSQSWFANKVDCFLWGGALATSDSAAKNTGLKDMIFQKFGAHSHGPHSRPVYIGLSDPSGINTWMWIGNRQPLGAYNDWQ